MRKLFVLVIVTLFAPVALAKVWTTVYRCDGVTPLPAADPNHPTVYRDIMVGTRLVIVISSDKGESWWGDLLVSADRAVYGALSGRGYTRTSVGLLNYRDSCLESAGTTGTAALAYDYVDYLWVGLEFNTNFTPTMSGHPAVPGAWFVCDYRAGRVGACDVGLYDLSVSFDVPIETLSFTHVPSRDFNGDTVVNFQDLALLASHWSSKADPNSPDAGFDLNSDGHVDLGDLAFFSEYWLERADCIGLQ